MPALPLSIPQKLTWVSFVLLIFIVPFSYQQRSVEINLKCGATNESNPSFSSRFVPNFVEVMDVVLKKVSQDKWGTASVTSPGPKVFAFAQCHSDLSDMDCKLCFNQARVVIPRCLPATSARMYLDGCFVRYDNYSFYKESLDPRHDTVNCSQPTGILDDKILHMEFRSKVCQVIKNVTELARENGTFATAEARGGIVPAYALAQCWKSLEKRACMECLMKAGSALKKCAPGSKGSALFTGCYMQYSTERFFEEHYEPDPGETDRNLTTVLLIVSSSVIFVVLIAFGAFLGYDRLSKRKAEQSHHCRFPSNLHFKYEVLEKATEYFDELSKLGQGGAGSVFKGTLPDGRTVAVKRLVYNTRQWADQFFNEINLISGIRHGNLVKLLGCSIEGPESLLVYEYVPNRSLDQFLFKKHTGAILSWQQRFNIILGTAEGLAHLHGGSGVKIIHRDIKTSNILLDEKLTPKIADFGLARCVGADNSHISTGIAGTLGYMAPEYLVRGQLTEKADVYGFGVLVVEIACGRKNSVFSEGSSSILNSVWKNYKAEKITISIDPNLNGIFSEKEVANVLRIGLLCTQASPALRPSMAEVVQMLTNPEYRVPSPKQPPFLNASVLSADDITENCITKVSLSFSSAEEDEQIPAQLSSGDTQNSYCTTCPESFPSTSMDVKPEYINK